MDFPVLAYADVVSTVLPFGVGLYVWRSLVKEKLLFFSFTTIAFVTEGVTLAMALARVHNLWVLQIYNLFEFTFIVAVLSAWNERNSIKLLARGGIVIFLGFWIAAKLIGFEGFNDPALYTHTLGSAIIVVMASVSIYDLASQAEEPPFWRDMRFLVTSAALIYFAGNVMLFLLSDRIAVLHFEDAKTVWTLHWMIDIATNLLYAGGFVCLIRVR